MMCPIILGSNYHQLKRCPGELFPLSHLRWFQACALELRVELGQAWKEHKQGILSSESLIWVPTCHWTLLCSSVLVEIGL